MNPDRTARALHHLTLALAGVGLTLAELPYLPWLPFGLIIYLILILSAHTLRGSYVLPAWLANLLALLVVGGVGAYVYARAGAEEWAGDVPLPAVLVPYLGPVLMALLCVRLFRPRSKDDFWLLQGLGLLQIGLACVLANGTLFAMALLAYLVTAAGALATGERERRGRRSSWVSGPGGRTPGWMSVGLRWGLGVAVLAVPLFLLSPRTDQPEWDPLSRFGVRSPRTGPARTGFSEEIDLGRTGRLVPDETPAFWVDARDQRDQFVDALAGDARFRGAVLDRYEQGVWRSESTWPGGLPVGRARPQFLDLGPDAVKCRFRVPRRTGGLFLVDPVQRSPVPNHLPIRSIGETAESGPVFFEVGGVPVPLAFLVLPEYRYEQHMMPERPHDRATAPRYRDNYLTRLLRSGVPGLETWTRDLLMRLPDSGNGLRAALRASRTDLPPVWWEAMARGLTAHLARSGEYEYSLETVRTDLTLDPTIDFLWHVKRGPCERYASALALMLRSQGIPTRLVKGYRGLERQGTGQYVVRQSQAHAWVEVLVPSDTDPEGYDWLTLDPTPESDSAISSLARWWERQQRGGQEFWNELVVNYNQDQRARMLERLTSWDTLLGLVPWALGAAAVLGTVWFGRRMQRHLPPPSVLGVTALLTRLRHRLTAPGRLTVPDNATPAELAEAGGGWLIDRGLTDVAELPASIARLYYRVRFGGEEVGEAELHRAGQRLDQLDAALDRVRG